MGTNNQNCRHYTSIHLVSEWLLFSCLMPSEQCFSYIMAKTSYGKVKTKTQIGSCAPLITQHNVPGWRGMPYSRLLFQWSGTKNRVGLQEADKEPIWVFVLTLPELKPMIYHTIMHNTLKHEAVENVPGIT
jgi:hypothetical protein